MGPDDDLLLPGDQVVVGGGGTLGVSGFAAQNLGAFVRSCDNRRTRYVSSGITYG
ncbi:hypothetical protein [Streptomyces sp. NPDC001508]|uniref:hypothetical protein n=1 Tax=Streptomyces sp. NPDC001508 TaxID=3154656 RepID=UPI00332E2FA4